MQVERIIVNFNTVFGSRNRRRGFKRFSCFSRKRTDLSKKKLHGVCTLTKVYQYAKEERFLFFEPCRTLVDICMELLLRLTFLQQGALMFKVLDFVISDRNFFFLFCLFIYVFFFWVHQYKKEGFLRSEFWPFGNSQLSWVDGCFDFDSLLLNSIRRWRQLSTLTTGHGKCVWTQWLHRLIEFSLLYGNINLVWNRTAQPNAKYPHAESLLFHPSRTWSSILV